VTWEDKRHHCKRVPHFLLLPQLLLLSMTSCGMGYTFGRLQSAVPAVSLPGLSPCSLVEEHEKQKRLSKAYIPVVLTLFSSQI